ncbi:salivary peroxidase/catechol oxidase isoform X2 [Leptinotarsa decemlineata]
MKLNKIQFRILVLLFQINIVYLAGSDKDFRISLHEEVLKNLSITADDINSSIDFAYKVTHHVQRLENNIQWKVDMEKGSPNHGISILYRPDEEAVERGRKALIASKATTQLSGKLCADFYPNHHKCMSQINYVSFNGTFLHSLCTHTNKICSPEEYQYPYRSLDGSCNHFNKGSLGEAFTGFIRILPSDYSDGIRIPRRAHDKRPLPNARVLSNSHVDTIKYSNYHITMATLHWAQFLEHDLSRFASSIMIHSNHSIECCNRNGFNLAPRYLHPFCFPISIPQEDGYYSEHRIQCMSYVKSLPAIRSDCTLGPNEQINQATHYLDGSQIYGATFEKSSNLRTHVDGKLKAITIQGEEYLPLSANPTEDCQVDTNTSLCFISGDPRVNFLPHLTVLHTLIMREHNRIAKELASVNGDWDDETTFQETRRIVIAELQHITYNEWLPQVLDPNSLEKIHSAVYDEKIDPRVSNSFATAALRAFISMISENISLVHESRDSSSTLRLHEHFNKPEIILRPQIFDSLLRGSATQIAGSIDMNYTEDVINRYSANGSYGYDVLSLDIQRGRDHGLPSYNDFRRLCGLIELSSFVENADHIGQKNLKALQKLYSHPNDVDLIIGGLMEEPKPLLGPTFSCIIEDQMIRSKKGDRYFYTNQDQPNAFSDLQLKEIQKVSLARIICDNAKEIESMQPNVFEKIGERNNLVPCDSEYIPKMSLVPWMDNRERYYN